MIQLGEVAFISPTSIQPESLVTTMGATSEGLFAGRAKLRFIPREVVFEFVMAFSFLSRVVLFLSLWFDPVATAPGSVS
jgi:hypothetical protein